MSHSNSQMVLQELDKMAQQLATRKCFNMAAMLLEYYDGEFALETNEARQKMAKTYRDLAYQEAIAREAAERATPKSDSK